MKTEPLTVTRLVDLFLAHVKLHSAPGTFKFYHLYLREFVTFVAPCRVDELTTSLVYDWLAKRYGKCSDSCRHGAARAIVRALNWAIQEHLIERSPLKHFKKPAPSRRETFITGAQYAALLKYVREHSEGAQTRADVIKFLWHSGARPLESRIVEASWLTGSKIEIPKELSKGKRKARVIYLDSMAAAIVRRLAAQHPTGPLFRNHFGKAWGKNSLGLMLNRLGRKISMADLCAYSFRHAYITRLLEKGIDAATVAELAGNSVAMVTENYNKIGRNESRLLAMLN
jgi:integrase